MTCNVKSVRGYNTYAEGSVRPRALPTREGFRFRSETLRHETCGATDESVTVHVDCIRLFGKTCSAKDKYRKLWIAGTMLYPWRGARSLMLDPMLYTTAESISRTAGFQKTFLPEVADLIGGNLQPSHPLLRFCKVIQLARYLNLAELGDAVTRPLCEVLSWSRGTSPIFVEGGQSIDRRMRLTIDSRGIKSIGMVSESESSEENTVMGSSCFTHVYIVESVKGLSGVDIGFQVSLSSTISECLLAKLIPSARNEPSSCSDICKHPNLEHSVATCPSAFCTLYTLRQIPTRPIHTQAVRSA